MQYEKETLNVAGILKVCGPGPTALSQDAGVSRTTIHKLSLGKDVRRTTVVSVLRKLYASDNYKPAHSLIISEMARLGVPVVESEHETLLAQLRELTNFLHRFSRMGYDEPTARGFTIDNLDPFQDAIEQLMDASLRAVYFQFRKDDNRD